MSTSQKIVIPVVGGSKKDATESVSFPATKLASHELVTQYVRVYLHNQRQGTAAAKDRSQVAGTTHKMYKQKGTGNARHGSAKAPIFKGGGVVGGPTPKVYESKMSKKQKELVYKTSLLGALSQNMVALLEKEAGAKAVKTKELTMLLNEAYKGKKLTLVVDPKEDEALSKSARNLSQIDLVHAAELNPFIILKSKQLIFTQSAWNSVVSRLS